MPDLRRVGAEAEDRAVDHLLKLGYTIVTRRFKSRRGEIDVIAFDGEVLVFVEVKSTGKDDVEPELAVDEKKLELIYDAAEEYLRKSSHEPRVTRFDLIAVTPSALRHHKDAFRI
ncbi:MAG: YraN family protein [Armatimonadetes bacterium]|nr:YraN family protein [Armatimonadota bacterium]